MIDMMIDMILDIVFPVALMVIPVMAAIWSATFVFGREETIGWVKRRSQDVAMLAEIAVMRLMRAVAVLLGVDEHESQLENLSRDVVRLDSVVSDLLDGRHTDMCRNEQSRADLRKEIQRLERQLEQITIDTTA